MVIQCLPIRRKIAFDIVIAILEAACRPHLSLQPTPSTAVSATMLASLSLSIVQWIQHVSKKMNGYQVELYSPSLLPFPLWLHSVCGPVPLGFLRLANTWPSISVTGSGSSVSQQWKPGVHLAQRCSEMRCMYALLPRISHNSQSSDCHSSQGSEMSHAILPVTNKPINHVLLSVRNDLRYSCQNQRCLSNCPVSFMGLLFGAIVHIAVVVERFWTQDEQFRSVGTKFQMYR